MSETRPRRDAGTSRRSRLIRGGWWVLLIAVIVLGTNFVPAGEEPVSAEGLDPATFASEVYEPDVVPFIEANAVDLTELMTLIEADLEAAGEEHGHRNGESPYSFPVRLTGTVVEGPFGEAGIEVDGFDSEVDVGVQTGPAVLGTALRDAVDFITFDEFRNQIEFANVASALNDITKETVLADTDFDALQGQEVTVVGAFTYDDPSHVTVTAVSIEAS